MYRYGSFAYVIPLPTIGNSSVYDVLPLKLARHDASHVAYASLVASLDACVASPLPVSVESIACAMPLTSYGEYGRVSALWSGLVVDSVSAIEFNCN